MLEDKNMEIIIITGLSGAGKSMVADCFEDLGYYCIDNLPPSLIKDFIDLISQRSLKVDKAAFVVDIRGGESFDDIKQNLDGLRGKGIHPRILFVGASNKTILSRYSENRRMHPLATGKNNDIAIDEERARLEPIRRIADFSIDTTGMKNAELIHEIRSLLEVDDSKNSFRYIIQSFGYKYNIPQDVDYVFDTRFIPNPFYTASLRKKTGNSKKVRDFVMRSDEARQFMDKALDMVTSLKPAFVREGKNSLCVAFGCTGGQHRSVTMANLMAESLKESGEEVSLIHRDL